VGPTAGLNIVEGRNIFASAENRTATSWPSSLWPRYYTDTPIKALIIRDSKRSKFEMSRQLFAAKGLDNPGVKITRWQTGYHEDTD
jgi:hypothetical protein